LGIRIVSLGVILWGEMSVRLYSIFNKVFKVGSLFRGCGFSKIITKQGVKIHIISGSNEGQMLSKNLIEWNESQTHSVKANWIKWEWNTFKQRKLNQMNVEYVEPRLIESNESQMHLTKLIESNGSRTYSNEARWVERNPNAFDKANWIKWNLDAFNRANCIGWKLNTFKRSLLNEMNVKLIQTKLMESDKCQMHATVLIEWNESQTHLNKANWIKWM
jgi:hypothetical protein